MGLASVAQHAMQDDREGTVNLAAAGMSFGDLPTPVAAVSAAFHVCDPI
jgi:hypothetical protein